jgi:carbamoyltransferase
MVSYGVVALSHDAALAVLINEDVVFFKKASDYSGLSNDFLLNKHIVSDAFKIAPPDKIGFFENPYIKKYRQFISGQFKLAFDLDLLPKTYLERIGFNKKLIECHRHHESHVAYAMHNLKFSEAVYLIADAIGEMDTVSIWYVNGESIKKKYSIKYPASLGLFYSAFTKLIGMRPVKDEGKFMELSKLGNPEKYRQLVKSYLYKDLHLGIKDLNQTNLFIPDLAAAVQSVFQDEILRLVNKCIAYYPGLPIVFSGGCAYNKLAVEHVKNITPNFYTVHNPGDSSSSIGAAYLSYIKSKRL